MKCSTSWRERLEHVGKTALYQGVPEIFIHGMNLLRLRLGHASIDPRFTHLFMQTRFFREQVRQRVGHAVNQVSINQKNLGEVPFVIAPLAEQRRIVAKLELLLGKVTSNQQRLSRIPGLLKRFRQSVLAAACSGKLTADWREENSNDDGELIMDALPSMRQELWRKRNSHSKRAGTSYKLPFIPTGESMNFPDAWHVVTVSQIAMLDIGHAFKSSEFVGHGVRLLRGDNLEPGRLRWADTRYWPESKVAECKHLLIEEGEIILALDRPMISTGLKIARAAKNDLPCLLVQRMMRFKMVDQRLTTWLFFNLNLPAFIQHLSAGLTGTDLPHVTGTGIAEYSFALPPLSEQQEIVRRVKQLFAFANQIESRLKQAQTHVDRLTQSLLAKAFRGELVATEHALAAREGRDYEPASALLARIRDTAGISPKKTRKSRGSPNTA